MFSHVIKAHSPLPPKKKTLTMGLIPEAGATIQTPQPENWLILKLWYKLVYEQDGSKAEGVSQGLRGGVVAVLQERSFQPLIRMSKA